MKALLLFFSAVLISASVAAQCDELKPMFGGKCVKTAAMQKADRQFIQAQVKAYGSADSAGRVWVRNAWQAFGREQPETAMRNLNRAWLLDKQNPEIYFAYGHLTRYAFARNAPEADTYYELGRQRDPKKNAEPRSLARLLKLMQNQDNLSGAIDVSTQLVVGFPNYGKGLGYKNRAYHYTQAQLPDRALEDIGMALQLDPDDPEIYVARGFARSWQGEQQAALADYNQALKLKPNSGSAYRHRAMLYADKLQQPRQALDDIEKAIQLNPQEFHNFKVKSDILFSLNRKTEACASLKNATRSGNKSITEEYQAKCGKK